MRKITIWRLSKLFFSHHGKDPMLCSTARKIIYKNNDSHHQGSSLWSQSLRDQSAGLLGIYLLYHYRGCYTNYVVVSIQPDISKCHVLPQANYIVKLIDFTYIFHIFVICKKYRSMLSGSVYNRRNNGRKFELSNLSFRWGKTCR